MHANACFYHFLPTTCLLCGSAWIFATPDGFEYQFPRVTAEFYVFCRTATRKMSTLGCMKLTVIPSVGEILHRLGCQKPCK